MALVRHPTSCFNFRFSDNCYLYGVFDGHCGIKAAEFVSQRLPAEIVLGQLNNITCETEVQQLLQQVRCSWMLVDNCLHVVPSWGNIVWVNWFSKVPRKCKQVSLHVVDLCQVKTRPFIITLVWLCKVLYWSVKFIVVCSPIYWYY